MPIRYFTVIVLLAIATNSGLSQEVCNNGIDDDNNGLIDLQDSTCFCRDSLPPVNYLNNPSFEDYVTCPQLYVLGGLGLNHFPYWSSAPFTGDVNYFNSTCPASFWIFQNDSCPPAFPIPNGKGFIMIQNTGDIGKGGKNYAATSPENTLRAGRKYIFECFVGGSTGNTQCQINFGRRPVTVALFGNPDRNADRFTAYVSEGCPMNPHPEKPFKDWELLGSMTVSESKGWQKIHIEFSPVNDINLLLVGPDCVNLGVGVDQYFYLDDFSLSEKENFAFKTIAVVNDCVHDIQLTAPVAKNANYQWYKDSIAIIGATNSVYTVPSTASKGNYNVQLVFPHTCLISSTVTIDPAVFKNLSLGNDTTLCIGESLKLQANIPDQQYLWPDGTTTNEFMVTKTGDYSLQVRDKFGCSTTTKIKVNFESCIDCPVNVPSAFSPNGDGRNDVFKVLSDCMLIEGFSLGIYNRWGQKVYETNDITRGWDGNLSGKPLPVDTYVYQLQFKRYGTRKLQQKWGTVTLIR